MWRRGGVLEGSLLLIFLSGGGDRQTEFTGLVAREGGIESLSEANFRGPVIDHGSSSVGLDKGTIQTTQAKKRENDEKATEDHGLCVKGMELCCQQVRDCLDS